MTYRLTTYKDPGVAARRSLRRRDGVVDYARRARLPRQQYDATIAKAQRERLRRYAVIIGLAGIVCVAIYAGYAYLIQPASQTIFGVIGWSIVANLLGDGVGYVVARMLDNFPEAASTISENFKIRFEREVNEGIEDEITSHEFKAMDEMKLAGELSQVYRKVIGSDPDGWHQIAAVQLQSLKELYAEYNTVWVQYLEIVERTVTEASSYFSDATKNFELLNAVASRIKEGAIEPSFVLLNRTRQSLDEVKKEIQSVDFS